MKKRIILNFLKLSLLLLTIHLPINSFAMDVEDVFKIKFATQKIQVRTSDNEYVDSTWEKTIPNQGLAEKSAKDGCKIDPQGMCCSHAVVCALGYCYDRTDLLASYLHKAVTGGYDKGMNLEEAMNFVKKNGVMALPPGQVVKHGSGLSWPDGTRYKFTKVINADNDYSFSQNVYPDKASRYRAILKKYNHPIVVSILSGYKGHRDKSPFLNYRETDQENAINKNYSTEIQNHTAPLDAENLYHAIILYGFRESNSCFFVKNSWGPKELNGLCTLPYDYINKFAGSAFIGLGHDDWEGDGIKEGQDKQDLVEGHSQCSVQ